MAEVLTSIEELRSRIDVIDEQLVRLLNVRVACAVEVGRLKHEAGLPIYQPEREAQVLASVRKSACRFQTRSPMVPSSSGRPSAPLRRGRRWLAYLISWTRCAAISTHQS